MAADGLSTILLDVEGTASPIAFVHEVMYGYARRELAGFLSRNIADQSLAPLWDALAAEAGAGDLSALVEQMGAPPVEALRCAAVGLMDVDAKATALKSLQGRIWKAGFESGELKAQIFEDVPRALERWTTSGVDVRIYSSGSVEAQRLFFEHSEFGDLRRHIAGYYDTTTGPKRAAESYRKIAADIGRPAASILFLSDVVAELDGAQAAGMQTGLMLRPGNAPVDGDHVHRMYETFDEIA